MLERLESPQKVDLKVTSLPTWRTVCIAFIKRLFEIWASQRGLLGKGWKHVFSAVPTIWADGVPPLWNGNTKVSQFGFLGKLRLRRRCSRWRSSLPFG